LSRRDTDLDGLRSEALQSSFDGVAIPETQKNTMTEHSDDELVSHVVAGRTDFYEEIVRRYQNDVAKVVCTLLYNQSVTEDIVQQVFVDAYRKLSSFRKGRDFGAWIRTIARNAVKMELRRKSRYDRRLKAYHEMYERRLSQKENKAGYLTQAEPYLQSCIDKLAPRVAAALRRRYTDGAKIEAIAGELCTSAGAVRNLLSRARVKLRACIERAIKRNGAD
jgi:RNA polymerase sigma-70 factor (ECF subfamily)